MKPIFLIAFICAVQSFAASIEFEGPWTDAQRLVFARLTGTAQGRLFSKTLVDCKNRVRRFANVDDDSFKRAYSIDLTEDRLASFMDVQLLSLQQIWMTTSKMPPITLRLVNKPDSPAAGWAHYAYASKAQDHLIRVGTTGNGGVAYTGRFEIELNAAKFGDMDESEWIGIIAHEMLHNLMHAHPNAKDVGVAKAYDDDWEIVAAERCVAHNMRYQANQVRVTPWLCGGRSSEN